LYKIHFALAAQFNFIYNLIKEWERVLFKPSGKQKQIMTRFLLYITILLFCADALAESKGQMEFELIIKDHKFEPDVLEVPANTKIILIIDNQDKTIEEFDSPDLKREKIIPGGSSVKVILAPLKPGEYKFSGEFHEETAKGKIIVK